MVVRSKSLGCAIDSDPYSQLGPSCDLSAQGASGMGPCKLCVSAYFVDKLLLNFRLLGNVCAGLVQSGFPGTSPEKFMSAFVALVGMNGSDW